MYPTLNWQEQKQYTDKEINKSFGGAAVKTVEGKTGVWKKNKVVESKPKQKDEQNSLNEGNIINEITKGSVAKQGAEESFGSLRYPYSTLNSDQDFMRFSVYNYRRGEGNITRNQDSLKAKGLGHILLPIPANLVDSNNAGYTEGNMNFLQEGGFKFGQDILKGGDPAGTVNRIVSNIVGQGDIVKDWFAMQAVNQIGGNLSFDQILARSSGNIINPNMELLFKGPTLRNFDFEFRFTPRFQKEAQTVRTIIKAFKRNMAPKGSGGTTLRTPNIFEIQYVGKANAYLNRIKLCALQNVSMNYTGDGTWATYNDGSPISMTMRLSFKELTPVYNEDYEAYGTSSDGVGY